jgi:diguanylate cyclase (GGDEF)-like protein
MTSPDSPDADAISQLLGFVERTSDLVGVVDEQSRVTYLNEAARKRLGVGDAMGLTASDLFPPHVFARYYDELRPALLHLGTWHGELAVLSVSGEIVPMTMTVVARVGPGGEVTGLVTIGREIAASLATAVPSEFVYDELTGLPGRAILDDRMRVALAHAARDGRRIAVILADIDSMKDINDSFGHAVGDAVLRRVALSISRGLRTGDTVARVGGDEFVVLIDGLEETDTVWQVAERLRDTVCSAPVGPDPTALVVTASFGVAIATHDDAPAELLERADSAMYRAKAMGGAKVAVFAGDAEMTMTTLTDELAIAVSHGLIRPHVQPIVDLHSGAIVGYQGLARWDHPRRGLLDADEFIHFAANTPILPVIDLAVLRRTVAAAARASRAGTRVRAYGHLSRRLIGDINVERYLTEMVDDLGIDPSDLCVEIAHVLVARPSRTVKSTLHGLREIGIRTVLSGVDGECDVNEIVEYGFDELRLARRLVRDAAHDSTRRRVANGTIALARALGLTVTAVGIETEADRIGMADAGCDHGQGNLFGPVEPAGAID